MFPMIRHSLCQLALLCVVLSLLSFRTASAQLQTESFNVGLPLQNLSSSGNFTLPDFDETLGTLDGVSLTFAVNNSATIQVYNTLSSPVNFTNACLGIGFGNGSSGIEYLFPRHGHEFRQWKR
jgi:hypothetical protein